MHKAKIANLDKRKLTAVWQFQCETYFVSTQHLTFGMSKSIGRAGHVFISAMRQRILGSHTPPCHRRMVITTQFSVLLCCTAAQTKSVPLQVAADCALALAICTFGSARTHHPPTVPVSL